MKKLIPIILLIGLFGCASQFEKTGAGPYGVLWKQSGTSITPLNTSWKLLVGSPISATGTEKTVWQAEDSNGDVVASCTVECSDITDGQQVCQIHYYVMSDTPGTLTKEFTIDVDSD